MVAWGREAKAERDRDGGITKGYKGEFPLWLSGNKHDWISMRMCLREMGVSLA